MHLLLYHNVCLYCHFIMTSATYRGHGGQTKKGRLYEGALGGHVLTREKRPAQGEQERRPGAVNQALVHHQAQAGGVPPGQYTLVIS